MTKEAANAYYTSLWKNRYNTDAQIGMKKMGQQVLNQRLSEWSMSRMSEDHKQVVYDYLEIMDYHSRIDKVGIELDIPDFYQKDYEAVKIDYLHDIYEEGTALLEEEKYQEAETVFREITILDPGFKDTGELKDVAYLEPLYLEGTRAMEFGQYRKANECFEKIMERKDSYKDTRELNTDALKEGMFTLAVLPFENATGKQGLEAKAQAYALQSLTNLEDPFLKVVNREDMDAILEEQRLGMTGVIDEETASEVGELIGAKAILRGTLLSHSTTRGNKQSYNREGFEEYRVKKFNRQTQKYYYDTKYKAVTYKEHTLRNSARVTYQFRVVSLATGEVLASDILEEEVVSETTYITYTGDVNKLYPSSGGGVNRGNSARSLLRKQFNAPREVKTTAVLSDEVFQKASADMSGEVSEMLNRVIE